MQSTEERNRRGPILLIGIVFLGALLVVLAIVGLTHALAKPQQQVATAAASQLLGPVNSARDEQVQAAVHEAQVSIQQALTVNSDLSDVSTVPLQQAYPGVTVSASGAPTAYRIVGRNSKSSYTYTYDSTTGQYTAG
jgi:hypothetical protein